MKNQISKIRNGYRKGLRRFSAAALVSALLISVSALAETESAHVLVITSDLSKTSAQQRVLSAFEDPRNSVGVLIDPSARQGTQEQFLSGLTPGSLAYPATRARLHDPWHVTVVVPGISYLPSVLRRHFEEFPELIVNGTSGPVNVMAAPVFCAFSSFGVRAVGSKGCLNAREAKDYLRLRAAFVLADAQASEALSRKDAVDDARDFNRLIEDVVNHVRRACPRSILTIGEYLVCSQTALDMLELTLQATEKRLSQVMVRSPDRRIEKTVMAIRIHHRIYSELQAFRNVLDRSLEVTERNVSKTDDSIYNGLSYRVTYRFVVKNRTFDPAIDSDIPISGDAGIRKVLVDGLNQMLSEMDGLVGDVLPIRL